MTQKRAKRNTQTVTKDVQLNISAKTLCYIQENMPKAARHRAVHGGSAAVFSCLRCGQAKTRWAFYNEGHHTGACVPAVPTDNAFNQGTAQLDGEEVHAWGEHHAHNGWEEGEGADHAEGGVGQQAEAAGQQPREEEGAEVAPSVVFEVFRRLMRDAEVSNDAAQETGGGLDQQQTYTAKEGTAEWYRERSNQKIYEGAGMTVMQAVYTMLQVRASSYRRHHLHNAHPTNTNQPRPTVEAGV